MKRSVLVIRLALAAVLILGVSAGTGRSDGINCNCPNPIAITADLTGLTLTPGCYRSSAAFAITATLTLTAGAPGASKQFIFTTPAALNTAASSNVVLSGGVKSSDIKWCIGAAMTIGASATFFGNVQTGPAGAITIGANAVVTGILNSGAGVITAGSFAALTPCLSTDGSSSATATAICRCVNPIRIPNALNGQTLLPGCYQTVDATQPWTLPASGVLTLRQAQPAGSTPDAKRFVFVSQSSDTFGVGADSIMQAVNGTGCGDVNWCVNGDVALGDRAAFLGHVQTGAGASIRLGVDVKVAGSLSAGSGVVMVASDATESAAILSGCNTAAARIQIVTPQTVEEQYQFMFAQFMYSHNKLYRCDSLTYRYAVFKANLQAVQAHNTVNTGFALGMNEFGDATAAEFKAKLGFKAPAAGGVNAPHVPAPVAPEPNSAKALRVQIQSQIKAQSQAQMRSRAKAGGTIQLSVDSAAVTKDGTSSSPVIASADTVCPVTATGTDWRPIAVTSVKNQGACGSCYGFSAAGAMEGAFAIATATVLAGSGTSSLAVEEIIECSQPYGNLGCTGGYMTAVFDYAIAQNGVSFDSAYPYTAGPYATIGSCGSGGSTVVPANAQHISSYATVAYLDESALAAAVDLGPVSVAISADSGSFQFYSSGVYADPTCSTVVDHGVLVVGYGTDPVAGPYWIVKNSWGTTWGQAGFVYIQRGVNRCGIAQGASYPIV